MLAALDGVFFSLNKQAFVNYYYFVIAALWLAVATADVSPTRTITEPGPAPAS